MANTFHFVPLDIHGSNKNRKRPVIMLDKQGRGICKYPSVRDAARLMNITQSNIVACLKGRIKTAGGYCWKYADGERKEGE